MLGNQVIRARHGIISLADHPLALSNSLRNKVSNIHQQALSAYPRRQHKPRLFFAGDSARNLLFSITETFADDGGNKRKKIRTLERACIWPTNQLNA